MLALATKPERIGGGVVRRICSLGRAGTKLSGDQIRAIPANNRQALIENRFIEVFPAPEGGERHIVSAANGKFDVIDGRKLNDEPLSRKDAEALARAR